MWWHLYREFENDFIYSIRGDHIVPNFEEIWPSGKTKPVAKPKFDMDYLMSAMNSGIPGERNKDFTTVGKPRVSLTPWKT